MYLIYDRQKNGSNLVSGEWELPLWKWDGVSTCTSGFEPPAGLFKPERGFGWLWCTHLGGAGGPLGWALEREFPGSGLAQRFERGLAFKGNTSKTYALLDDGRFLADDSALEQRLQPVSTDFTDTGFRPAEIFTQPWNALGEGGGPLGYPLGSAITGRNYARQPFEHGFMFWWEAPQHPQPIWVIYMPDPLATHADTWQQYQNKWFAGQPEYPLDCPEATAPLGPKFGFGVTWCYETGVKDLIGRPLKEEFGSGDANPKGAVQFFQGGVMFENPADRQVWVLVARNGWYNFAN